MWVVYGWVVGRGGWEVGRQVGRQVGALASALVPVCTPLCTATAPPSNTLPIPTGPPLLAAETAVLASQAAASGKPAAIVDKIVAGRLAKFYEDAVLLEQRFVMDEAKSVKAVAAAAGLEVAGFVRLQVGEGVEKGGGAAGFAADVAAMVQGG